MKDGGVALRRRSRVRCLGESQSYRRGFRMGGVSISISRENSWANLGLEAINLIGVGSGAKSPTSIGIYSDLQ